VTNDLSAGANDLCAPQTLTAADGAELIACAHGGHILGWTPAGGQPRLWLSPSAQCGPGLAIRGGIPVIFPQFSGRGPLPKHGLARDRGWLIEESQPPEKDRRSAIGEPADQEHGRARDRGWVIEESRPAEKDHRSAIGEPAALEPGLERRPHEPRLDERGRLEPRLDEHGRDEHGRDDPELLDDGIFWRATLSDDEATRAIWPHHFRLTLSARAAGNRLEVTLGVRNEDDVEWSFAAALHTYLALGDPDCLIHGLGGRTAENNAEPGRILTLGAVGSQLPATQARDVAALAAPEPLRLDDPVFGPLLISADGFPDRVVWNPGPGHGLADVPAGAERNFVCIEPAALTPIAVRPGSTWNGRLILQARAFETS
jgi:D-hexose-6-phosphate mutarotase